MPQPSETFEALGTFWEITTDAPLSNKLLQQIRSLIDEFDKTYSRFRRDSLVTQMAKKPGTYTFPDDSVDMFEFYRQLYDLTQGKVTPLIGEALERAGYDATYSFNQRQQKKVPGWDDVLRQKGTTIQTTQPIALDVGAAGKGRIVDEVGELLLQNTINEFVVDASGDLIHRGLRENRVGLEHPLQPDVVIGVVDVRNKSLCASASNRRAWGNGQHHIFDPDTLQPTNNIIATWVVADSTMVADGLATALFFTDPAVLATQFSFEYVRMHDNGSIDYNRGFSGELF